MPRKRSEPKPATTSPFEPKPSGSFEQVTAVVCFIFSFVPIFGIFCALVACGITWQCKNWTRMTAIISLMLSILVTIFYYVV